MINFNEIIFFIYWCTNVEFAREFILCKYLKN